MNASTGSICSRQRARSIKFSDVNKVLYSWYVLVCLKNIYLSGSQLCEKAREIVEHLHAAGFKASNGWIERWKRCYNVRHVKISGESADVSGITIES